MAPRKPDESTEEQIRAACALLGCHRSELSKIGRHKNGTTYDVGGVTLIDATVPDAQGRTGLMILSSPQRVSGPLAYFGEQVDDATGDVIIDDTDPDDDTEGTDPEPVPGD